MTNICISVPDTSDGKRGLSSLRAEKPIRPNHSLKQHCQPYNGFTYIERNGDVAPEKTGKKRSEGYKALRNSRSSERIWNSPNRFTT